MNTTDLLARIDKMGPEWRHPQVVNPWELDPNFYSDIALDLHLRHIAERLILCGNRIYLGGTATAQFVVSGSPPNLPEEWAAEYDYAEALVSAAEAVGGGK
jgi:hypothetical protein